MAPPKLLDDHVRFRFADPAGACAAVALDCSPAVPGPRDFTAVDGSYRSLEVVGETAAALPVTVWSPDGCTDRDALPLLVVHDGPEYDRYAAISRFSAAQTAAGGLPAHRVALVHPVERDAWYSGSPQYLRTLVQAGLGQITRACATAGPLVVMGASLGGLTALLAGRTWRRRCCEPVTTWSPAGARPAQLHGVSGLVGPRTD